jgi:hypothetical protein
MLPKRRRRRVAGNLEEVEEEAPIPRQLLDLRLSESTNLVQLNEVEGVTV